MMNIIGFTLMVGEFTAGYALMHATSVCRFGLVLLDGKHGCPCWMP